MSIWCLDGVTSFYGADALGEAVANTTGTCFSTLRCVPAFCRLSAEPGVASVVFSVVPAANVTVPIPLTESACVTVWVAWAILLALFTASVIANVMLIREVRLARQSERISIDISGMSETPSVPSAQFASDSDRGDGHELKGLDAL
jgi:hypothetical protein